MLSEIDLMTYNLLPCDVASSAPPAVIGSLISSLQEPSGSKRADWMSYRG